MGGDVDQVMTDERLDSLERRMDAVEKAFPGNDPEGHRRAHETMIEELAERRRLRLAITEKTVAGLVWAILVALGIAVWQYFKKQVNAP